MPGGRKARKYKRVPLADAHSVGEDQYRPDCVLTEENFPESHKGRDGFADSWGLREKWRWSTGRSGSGAVDGAQPGKNGPDRLSHNVNGVQNFRMKVVAITVVLLGCALIIALQLRAVMSPSSDGNHQTPTRTSSSSTRETTGTPQGSHEYYKPTVQPSPELQEHQPSLNLSWRTTAIPATSTEASVRLYDVNNDGVLDAILAMVMVPVTKNKSQNCDFFGFSPCGGAVIARDGRDGSLLWMRPTASEVFAVSCGVIDGNGDGFADCLISGRSSQLSLINARNGEVIWDAYERLKPFLIWNVYSPIITHDLDEDGVQDVLVAHGGDMRAQPWEVCRRAGELRFFSGASGNAIGRPVTMPEHRETYMSPVLFKKPGRSEEESIVFFGTGGETINGSLWAIQMKDLISHAITPALDVGAWQWGVRKSEDFLSGAIRLVTGVGRGVAVPPIIVEMTGDDHPDVLVSVFDGTLLLLDGRTSEVVWRRDSPGWEFYSSPAVGRFNGDSTPDVLLQINKGSWFINSYEFCAVMVLDGRDGSVLWQMTTAVSGMRSPLVLHRSATDPRGDLFIFWVSGRKVWKGAEITSQSCQECDPSESVKRKKRRKRRKATSLNHNGEVADSGAGMVQLAVERQEAQKRTPRHSAPNNEHTDFVPPTDGTCSADDLLLGEKLMNRTLEKLEKSTSQRPVGALQALCNVDESVYDVETFLLDYEHRCNPVLVDSTTVHSIPFAWAMETYSNETLWKRYKEFQVQRLAHYKASHTRKKRHEGEGHGDNDNSEVNQGSEYQADIEEHDELDFAPSYDPRLCASMRPQLVATPAAGDVDRDGAFDLVLPTAHTAFVKNDRDSTVRMENMASFSIHKLFPYQGLSSVSHCHPGSNPQKLEKDKGIHTSSLLPPKQQSWLGYLGTCVTSDMTREHRCGAV